MSSFANLKAESPAKMKNEKSKTTAATFNYQKQTQAISPYKKENLASKNSDLLNDEDSIFKTKPDLSEYYDDKLGLSNEKSWHENKRAMQSQSVL